MILYEISDEVISTKATYNIGFVNDEGRTDETQFDAENIEDLRMLWEDFCKENRFCTNSILYVERLELEELKEEGDAA